MSVSYSSSTRSAKKTQTSSKSVVLTASEMSFMNDGEIGAIYDAIEKLTERQKLCTKTYHFKEAEEIKLKVKELKKSLVAKKKKKIEKRHKEELAQILEAQAQETERFNEFWDEKIEEFQQESLIVERQMSDKHQDEIETTRTELNVTLSVKPIKSAEHLKYIGMVASLAKNGEFADAEKCMKKCSDFEKQALSKAKAEKEKKVKLMVSQLENKRKMELNSLKKKINSGNDQMAKLRKEEHEKLQHRFRNMIQELENAQHLELSKFTVSHRNYAPKEEGFGSPNKRQTTVLCTSSDMMSNSGMSLSSLDNSFEFFECLDDGLKNNLAGKLVTEPAPPKSKFIDLGKHKRVGSFQRS